MVSRWARAPPGHAGGRFALRHPHVPAAAQPSGTLRPLCQCHLGGPGCPLVPTCGGWCSMGLWVAQNLLFCSPSTASPCRQGAGPRGQSPPRPVLPGKLEPTVTSSPVPSSGLCPPNPTPQGGAAPRGWAPSTESGAAGSWTTASRRLTLRVG